MSLAVVIPAYMAESTIEAAVASAFAAGAVRVVVVDDGSTDGTYEAASRAGATCIRQTNQGAAKARIAGARNVVEDFLVFLDADDRLIGEGVIRSVDHLRANPATVVSAGTVVGVGAGGRERAFPIRYSPITTTTLLEEGYGPWPPCAAVIRTEAYQKSQRIAPIPLTPPFAEDYEMLIRLSIVGCIDVRDDPTCFYAISGGKSEKSAQLAIQAKEKIRSYYSEKLAIPVDMLRPKHVRMAADVRQARAAFASKRWLDTARILLRWVSRDPFYAAKTMSSRPWKRN